MKIVVSTEVRTTEAYLQREAIDDVELFPERNPCSPFSILLYVETAILE